MLTGGSMLTADEKDFLTWLFEALGPERVQRASRSYGHGWADCFLALAYGNVGDLHREYLTRAPTKPVPGAFPWHWYAVSRALNLPVPDIARFLKIWDRDDVTKMPMRDAEVRELAAWWLEEQPKVSRSTALVTVS
jgi:hypothetical protein